MYPVWKLERERNIMSSRKISTPVSLHLIRRMKRIAMLPIWAMRATNMFGCMVNLRIQRRSRRNIDAI
jgi:hypothetical protein